MPRSGNNPGLARQEPHRKDSPEDEHGGYAIQAFGDLNVAAVRSMQLHMQAIGYVRVSTDQQAEQGVSLEAQEAKIRAMATVQSADLVNAGKVEGAIVAKLDRLTRNVKDLADCWNYSRSAMWR